MSAGRNKVNETAEALAMKAAFAHYVISHGLHGPMDPDARKQKRNAFKAGWKAAMALRAAAEPEEPCSVCRNAGIIDGTISYRRCPACKAEPAAKACRNYQAIGTIEGPDGERVNPTDCYVCGAGPGAHR